MQLELMYVNSTRTTLSGMEWGGGVNNNCSVRAALYKPIKSLYYGNRYGPSAVSPNTRAVYHFACILCNIVIIVHHCIHIEYHTYIVYTNIFSLRVSPTYV